MLILIVGPSGAGKDTLLDAARAVLESDPNLRFARRTITRAATPGGEQHLPISRDAFDEARAANGFYLSWEAHGLGYGIPGGVAEDLAAGRCVVASVSRAVIAEARSRTRTQVIEITAPSSVLAARLALRGREGAADIAERLARTVERAADDRAIVISNDGTVAEGAEKLIEAILRLARISSGE